jgi:hypothetical protein
VSKNTKRPKHNNQNPPRSPMPEESVGQYIKIFFEITEWFKRKLG